MRSKRNFGRACFFSHAWLGWFKLISLQLPIQAAGTAQWNGQSWRIPRAQKIRCSLQPDTPAAGESHKKDSTQGVADSLLAVCLCLADFHDAGFN